MAKETSRYKIPYPENGKKSSYLDFESMINDIDQISFSNKEDSNMIYYGGGTVGWDGADFTFNADITVMSSTHGRKQVLTAAASPVTIPQGYYVVLQMARGATSEASLDATITVVSGVLIDKTSKILCYHADDGNLYFVTGLFLTIGSTSAYGLYPASPAAGGEANTASNVGTGQGLFKGKVGVDLEFLSLVDAGSNRIAIGTSGDDVTLDVDESNIDHQSLSGAGAYTHANIDTHINDLDIHREMDDSTETLTNLWSATKIAAEIAAGGGGSSTFTGLTDTPAAYTGQATRSVRVNAGETALEFYTPAGSSSGIAKYIEVDIDFNAPTFVSASLIPDDAIVLEVLLRIDIAFAPANSIKVEVQGGGAVPEIMGIGSNDADTPDLYVQKNATGINLASTGPVLVTIGGALSVGSGKVIVQYVDNPLI